MWMYKTRESPLPLSLSLSHIFHSLTHTHTLSRSLSFFLSPLSSFHSLAFSHTSYFGFSRFFTPYKLELTLEILELYPVISVSGIQYVASITGHARVGEGKGNLVFTLRERRAGGGKGQLKLANTHAQ